jgi:putative tryptophan/tyrosine transport system substrate-binding protein
MRRREFLALAGGMAAWPHASRAQSKPAVVGMLGSGFAASSAILIDSFKQGMRENGLSEGHDYVLDVLWAEGDYTRFATLVSVLMQHKPNVIIVTTIAAARTAQQLAPATPLVMTGLIDPVGAGLIASLARPGGNTTGISNLVQDVTVKGLELLRTAVPKAKLIATLFNPANPGNRLIISELRTQAEMHGLAITAVEFRGAETLEATFGSAANDDALLILGDSALLDLRERIATLALQHKLPSVTSTPEFTDVGALIGYGPSRKDIYRRAAVYVKKVLNGERPGDLPVEQPTRIELSINLKTARTLGITIPDSLLARADRVIE